MNDLRQLINQLDHIEKDGDLTRELDPTTGRIISKPFTENIARLIGAGAVGGGLALGANWLKDKFFSDTPDSNGPKSNGPKSNKPSPNEPGNISDFTKGPNNNTFVQTGPVGSNAGLPPNGTGHAGSNISPNDDAEDPNTWPPGVKKAPDSGYLDSKGMWIPTPFNIRTGEGKFGRWLPNSPANLVGIPANQWTPFQQKVERLQRKNAFVSSSAIEQSKSVKLPGGAPHIPGYKQIDPSKFSTDASGPGVNKTLDWVYAYQNGKNFILIAPDLFYNTKVSIGRYYPTWTDSGIRSNNDRVSSTNGTVYVAAQNFNVNDMILIVVVHTSIGAGNIGPQVLKSIQGSFKSV
jgi:hypothetical protein